MKKEMADGVNRPYINKYGLGFWSFDLQEPELVPAYFPAAVERLP
jgi:hypothetical protein